MAKRKKKHLRELTAERLRELLSYDPETGVFRWRITRTGTARAGTVAGGKTQIGIDGRAYTRSRLVWLYIHGCWARANRELVKCARASCPQMFIRDPERVHQQAHKIYCSIECTTHEAKRRFDLRRPGYMREYAKNYEKTEKARETRKRYRESDEGREVRRLWGIAEYMRLWCRANREHINQRNRLKYAANPEKARQLSRLRRAANRERNAESSRVWRRDNREYYLLTRAIRRLEKSL